MPYTQFARRAIVVIVMVVAGFQASPHAQITPAVDTLFATVNLSYIAQSSKAGKAARIRIDVTRKTKEYEASKMAIELQRQEGELQRASVMSDRAGADLQKAFDKSRVAFDRFREDAQKELQDMQAALEADFRLKLAPIVEQISKEKGFHFVFGLEQATLIVWANPALDISDEVVKRLDAAP